MSLNNGEFIKTDDVVISGISGAFLNFSNIEEFKQNSLAENAMFPNLEKRGAVNGDLRRIYVSTRILQNSTRCNHLKQENINISGKLILEKVQGAILDAGYNPKQLNTSSGVFVGICTSGKNTTQNLTDDEEKIHFSRLGNILTNEISNWLNVRGCNTKRRGSCTSILWAIENAYKAIRNEGCSAAIVCGVNIAGPPNSKNFKLFGPDANEFLRGEALVVVFLQKKNVARRIYANIVDAKSSYEYYSTPQFHEEINTEKLPHKDEKILKVGKEKIFIPNHITPLSKTDTVQLTVNGDATNLHQLTKLVIDFEIGLIPSNITDESENNINKNLKIIAKLTQNKNNNFTINLQGAEWSNTQLWLTPHDKNEKKGDSSDEQLPRLVTVSGETENAVEVLFQNIEKNHKNKEYIGLLHEIFSDDIDGHAHRGYILLNKENDFTKHIEPASNERKPIWYIFPGLGSQWPTMGKSLMKISSFAESIRKSNRIMETKDVNLIEIITKDDDNILNILNSILGIVAIQIAMVDCLKTLDISPDGMIGFSAGEIVCAYVDGCLNREETLLIAFYAGVVTTEANFPHGTVVVIVAGYENIKEALPAELDICTYAAPLGYGVSGPTDIINNFAKKMEMKGFLVLKADTLNIPFHSRWVASAGPKYVSSFKKIIPQPRFRSKKWISTSTPENELNTDAAKFLTAGYFPNNFVNSIYFDRATRHIPDNAIMIEMGPHALLQPFLSSMPPSIHNIPLSIKTNEDGTHFFLDALGRIYAAGRSFKLSTLYRPVEYPVSRGTPMISSLIEANESLKIHRAKL